MRCDRAIYRAPPRKNPRHTTDRPFPSCSPSLGDVYSFLHTSWTPPSSFSLAMPSRPRCSMSSRNCFSVTPYWAGRPSIVAIAYVRVRLRYVKGFCAAATADDGCLVRRVLLSTVGVPRLGYDDNDDDVLDCFG